MKGAGYFVTGTDTDVGKTLVTSALIHGLVARGIRVAGMKPVASGAGRSRVGLRADDALVLMREVNVEADYSTVNPYAFEPAVSPHIAAAEAGERIDVERITERFQCLASRAEMVLVEGVGGWMAPLGDGISVEDMALRLGLPVILVVGMRLGCLNHALLTASAIRAARLPLAGWVANCVQADMQCLQQNIDSLRARVDAPLLGILPYRPGAGAEQFSGHLAVETLDMTGR